MLRVSFWLDVFGQVSSSRSDELPLSFRIGLHSTITFSRWYGERDPCSERNNDQLEIDETIARSR
jgi:hypothetical protein